MSYFLFICNEALFNPRTTGLVINKKFFLKITIEDQNLFSCLFVGKSSAHTLYLSLRKIVGKIFCYHDFYEKSRFSKKLFQNSISHFLKNEIPDI